MSEYTLHVQAMNAAADLRSVVERTRAVLDRFHWGARERDDEDPVSHRWTVLRFVMDAHLVAIGAPLPKERRAFLWLADHRRDREARDDLAWALSQLVGGVKPRMTLEDYRVLCATPPAKPKALVGVHDLGVSPADWSDGPVTRFPLVLVVASPDVGAPLGFATLRLVAERKEGCFTDG